MSYFVNQIAKLIITSKEMYDGKPIVPNKGRFVQPYTFSIMHYYYLLTYIYAGRENHISAFYGLEKVAVAAVALSKATHISILCRKTKENCNLTTRPPREYMYITYV